MSDIIDYNGSLFYTGNLVPDVKTTFAPKMVSTSTKTEIIDLIQKPTRIAKRQIFLPSWIRNQEDRGACNGFAAAQALQRALWLAGGEKVVLSGEFLYSQMNGGRDVGSMLDDGMDLLLSTGAPPYKDRHRRKFRPSDFTAEDFRDAANYKAFEIYGVDTELELAEGLAKGFVGVVAVHANNNFMRLDSNGIAGGANGPGNHAVGVDDVVIKNGELCFDMFNSWSTNYGDDGRAYLTWKKHFTQTSRNHYFYLIRATKANQSDDSPEPQRV